MWAQLVKMQVQPDSEDALQRAGNEWEDQVGRGTDSGWQRTLLFRDANDPQSWYQLVFFESEEKARANERSDAHQAVVKKLTSLIAGQPEYVDLLPIQETTR